MPFHARRHNFGAVKKASIVWDDDTQLYHCTFPLRWKRQRGEFNPENSQLVPEHQAFMDIFKSRVSAAERIWNKDAKVWMITEQYFDGVSALMEITFGEVFKFKKPATQYGSFAPATHDINNDLKTFETLLREAGAVEVKTKELDLQTAIKYYRKAALMFHPDRQQGFEKQMSSLTEVWSRLKGAYYK